MIGVVITTEYKGLFFGTIDKMPETMPESITLNNVRYCLTYPAQQGGFLGLAKFGPLESCTVSADAETAIINKPTCIAVCTETALDAWLSFPISVYKYAK